MTIQRVFHHPAGPPTAVIAGSICPSFVCPLAERAIRLGAAVAEKLPGRANLLDHVKVEIRDQQLVLVADDGGPLARGRSLLAVYRSLFRWGRRAGTIPIVNGDKVG